MNFSIVFRFDDRLFERSRGDATDVEGSHGQLGAGFADGLSGDDSHGFAEFDHLASGKIATVAFCTATALAFAGQYRANFHLLDADSFHCKGGFFVDQGIFLEEDLATDGVLDGFATHAANEAGGKVNDLFVALVDWSNDNSQGSAAVVLVDDDVL